MEIMINDLIALMAKTRLLNDARQKSLEQIATILHIIFEELKKTGIEVVNNDDYLLDTISCEKGKITLFFD